VTETRIHASETLARPRKRWKRRLVIASTALVALLVVGVGVLWILKPWVRDIVIRRPGPTGERIVERGVFANWFPAKGAEDGPAVLLFGGSEGGIGENVTRSAVDLQSKGFSVLTPSYFGAPGQRGNLELVPLETFDRALVWLRAQPEVDPDRVAVFGHSKGAEASLLVGVRDHRLRAVIASAPSSYVWPGIDWNSLWADASWTSDGKPLDALPYGPFRFQTLTGDVGRLYEEGLQKRDEHPDAAIPVERIEGRVLLVCGERDELWPSCPMSRQLDARASGAGHPSVRILAYEQAGHRVFGLPEPPQSQSLRRWGGDPAANNAARKDAWPQIVRFLREALADR
jgi:uncharacterized protein